ncbi:NAD(P)/FAD-dependent oxidoreductase [Aureimonas fodinaquatilis]|uniref:NAD(P)/FAD-dependent oxidoreductase n=1 Tax=Aureimonas fodinaquatilis TaxID=2565783 RepID=A0A5B0DZ01_9HYPH|nr:NAD(P)/FAD-dependent oxidoreductase [Aureimonas fodinaquatilis]KAA0970419.1 NAD(P)/FAD-dependent oxidoreductase [Aureimonas fodinaquatilis]
MANLQTDVKNQGLQQLEARLQDDLACLNYPAPNWVPSRTTNSGQNVSDVTIVGSGMCGLVAWFALRQSGVTNIRILDRAASGQEGPWVTYARMETLRSPKTLIGPAFGIASLTFRAWFTAQFGREAWDELYRIPRRQWMDYLRWYRKVLDIAVENGTELTSVLQRPDGYLELEINGGCRAPIITRKLVLATGREGMGDASLPSFIKSITRHLHWAHSSDPVDFSALRGKRVVVIGIGASAVDNAAEALEAGAGEVRLLARRAEMPQINKLMGVGSYGMTAGYAEMPAEWRWRFSHYAACQQTPAPHNSTLRVSRHKNAFFHFNCDIASVVERDGEIVLETRSGRSFTTDFVLLGTGFTVDPKLRPELRFVASHIACWEDRFTPRETEQNREQGRYPWLNDDFSFVERDMGKAPWLADIHCFNYASAMSLGKVSGDIPAISEGAKWLARSISAQLFNRDIQQHWDALQAYSLPELDGSEWTDADACLEMKENTV